MGMTNVKLQSKDSPANSERCCTPRKYMLTATDIHSQYGLRRNYVVRKCKGAQIPGTRSPWQLRVLR